MYNRTSSLILSVILIVCPSHLAWATSSAVTTSSKSSNNGQHRSGLRLSTELAPSSSINNGNPGCQNGCPGNSGNGVGNTGPGNQGNTGSNGNAGGSVGSY